MTKYSIDKTKIGRFTLFTIWNNENQRPLYDYSSQELGFRNAKLRAEKALKELIKIDHNVK